MPEETPLQPQRNKEVLEDNARKFVVESIDSEFLRKNNAKAYSLVVDWLETDEMQEKKVVLKRSEQGKTQYILVSKASHEGNRVTEKKKITEDEYTSLCALSIVHLEKKRYEFEIAQNGIQFALKYDEFSGGVPNMLEVDADNQEERGKFNPSSFVYLLNEVTGEMQYYGYRVAAAIK
jgi:hypothetical protein